MKHFFTYSSPILFGLGLALLPFFLQAQILLSGQVIDSVTKEALAGVSITIVGQVNGTITNTKGEFQLVASQKPPLQLKVSSVGYATQIVEVNPTQTFLPIALQEQALLGDEVIVSAFRIEENVLKSPVTVEKMDMRTIQSTPAASFYDALRNLKGVDISTQSLTFSSINTRGFAGNGNTRVVQMVDGMDNQAPGLGFAVGNMVGLSELDVESVELLPGAASALYGPNATNGLLLMNSKNPFTSQGISASVKTGIMHAANRTMATTPFYDVSVRYAKVIHPKLALKLNVSYLTAKDWQATDYRDQSFGLSQDDARYPGFNRTVADNQNYNGVNVYGDENSSNVNLASFRPYFESFMQLPQEQLAAIDPRLVGVVNGVRNLAALTNQSASTIINTLILPNQLVARTGYAEKDLVDYRTQSLKVGGALHYRITPKLEAILQGNWGLGTTVYTSTDRYYIKDFILGQYKLELKGDDFFIRGYTTQERSGNAYAAGVLASYLNEAGKPSLNAANLGGSWYPQYAFTYGGGALSFFNQAFQSAINAGQAPQSAYESALQAVQLNSGFLQNLARSTADQGRLMPGTPEFNAAAQEIKSTAIPSGAKFMDRTNLYHAEGMYNLRKWIAPEVLELLVGGNYRIYDLNSQGTIFLKKPNSNAEYNIQEWGGYVQASRSFASILKLTASLRHDKNENFKGQWSPRLSGVLTLAKQHNLRASYQTGFRIPTAQHQYINLETPVSLLVGGLAITRDRYHLNNYALYTYDDRYLAHPTDPSQWNRLQLNPLKPERVLTYEVGYKGLVLNRLVIDAYYYHSLLQNYIGGMVFVTPENPLIGTRTVSTTTNYNEGIRYQGFGLGLDYQLMKNLVVSGNLSNTTLPTKNVSLFNGSPNHNVLDDGFQVGFNTPKYRYNLSLTRAISANSDWGFNVTYRYQTRFYWNDLILPAQARTAVNSQQIVIPAYGTLDAQVSLKMKSIKSVLKAGANNLLNQAYTTAWANPQIGSMYYVGLTFDEWLR
ncbi:TonB-dependent receptor [Siphonobacter sp. SORGH_AS_0500]|uniref:TonB-dependent receptor n=1 Tax=Siphonobacter sp. SORGH_AS_0500 TaxID=1864824 RepID=UPI0028635F75|nr:TonB-dependent receptor [Siphonobacter sp. SORGH_AS_0500]MDR6197085.1 iron complex outermembrane receptor protein [Siphonobacter sp. SORGH_AS_0500]